MPSMVVISAPSAANRQGYAGRHHLPVEEDGAGPADADAATFLGAGQAEVVAEEVHQQSAGRGPAAGSRRR